MPDIKKGTHMTEPPKTPPEDTAREHERPGPEGAQAPAANASDAHETQAEHTDAATGENQPSEPFSIDKAIEQERLVWAPPLPQYPPRPTRQEPVQYESPRPQPAPQYAPQQYIPPQPAQPPTQAYPPATAPQPRPAPQQYIPAQPAYAAQSAGGYSAQMAPFGAAPPRVIAPPAPSVSGARVGRRMARRIVMGADGARKAMFGVRPGLVIAFIVLALFTGWMAYDKWLTASPTSATPNAPGKASTIALPPEVPAVQTYLTATAKSDADATWDTFSPTEKANRITNGEDKTVLTKVLSAIKQNQFVTNYRYVGGLGMNGSSDLTQGGFYFYVQDVSLGTQKQSFPMFFAVDDKGKITSVNDQLYKLILRQIGGGN